MHDRRVENNVCSKLEYADDYLMKGLDKAKNINQSTLQSITNNKVTYPTLDLFLKHTIHTP